MIVLGLTEYLSAWDFWEDSESEEAIGHLDKALINSCRE